MIYPGVGPIAADDLILAGVAGQDLATLGLRIDVGLIGHDGLSIRLDVGEVGASSLLSRIDVAKAGVPGRLALRLSVIDGDVLSGAQTASDRGSASAAWCCVVEIDGVDRSGDLTGEVVVEAEESAARVADLALHIPAGTVVAPTDWVGRQVRILFAALVDGVPVDAVPIFSGTVDLPALTPRSGLLRLRCTDNRQGVISSLTPAQVGDLIAGSRWSPVVFDAGATPWVQAGDRLSTVSAALDLDVNGVPRVTHWAANEYPDFSFGDDVVLDGSVSVDLADRGGMINFVGIEFGYRFPRLKSEGWLVGFDTLALHQTSFPYWVRDGNNFLERAAVEAALRQAGATIVTINWIELPTTPQVIPGANGAPAGVWIPNPALHDQLCLGFAAVVAFDYAQEVEETHSITVSAPRSVESIGSVRDAMSGALEGVYDDIKAIEQNILLFREKITTIPPGDMAPVQVGLTNSINGTLTTDSDRAAANVAMETLVAIARVTIQAAHRRNEVRASIPCLPVLDLVHTALIDAEGVRAQGKVRRFSHRLDVDAGSAITEIALAISAASGVGALHSDDPVGAPAGTTPSATPLPAPAVSWNGLAGQDQVITIDFPGVAEVERAAAQVRIPTAFQVAIPEDLLEITL